MRDKSTDFHSKYTVNARGTLLDLAVPKVMGILNLTPDSFYDGGRNNSLAAAIAKTAEMLQEGAALIDLGACSSRPGAAVISEEEEIARLLPVLRAICKEFPAALISVDTFRSSVARIAVGEGAVMVNDISGGEADPAMFTTVAALKVPYILMHMKGTPQNMTTMTNYDDLVTEIAGYFSHKSQQLRALGVVDIILDPGFGFAKTRAQSFELLDQLDQFHFLGLPLLAGVSRKSMIYTSLGTAAGQALNGTTVLNTIALLKGAGLLRVHDVKEAVEAVQLVQAAVNP